MKQLGKTRWLIQGMVLASGLMLGQAAWTAQPWVAVPSAATGTVVVVAGGNLAPWQAVTIKVTDPQGSQSAQSATADDKGVLKANVTPGAKGAYKVDVFNTVGQRIGGGDFIVSR